MHILPALQRPRSLPRLLQTRPHTLLAHEWYIFPDAWHLIYVLYVLLCILLPHIFHDNSE